MHGCIPRPPPAPFRAMHAPEHHPPRIPSLLLAAAAFVVVVAGLKAAQALVNPFLLAVFIAVISTPSIFWLESRGLPRALALLAVILVVIGALLGLSVVVGASINDFTNDLPRYTERLKGSSGPSPRPSRGSASSSRRIGPASSTT